MSTSPFIEALSEGVSRFVYSEHKTSKKPSFLAETLISGAIYTSSAFYSGQMTKILKKPEQAILFGITSFIAGKFFGEVASRFLGKNKSEKFVIFSSEHFGGILAGFGYLRWAGVKMKLIPRFDLALSTFSLSYTMTCLALRALKNF